MLGFGVLDAVYQTVTTVTTVGFREIHPLTTAGKIFTIALILVGVGTALYTFGVVLEALVEGHLRTTLKGDGWSADRPDDRSHDHLRLGPRRPGRSPTTCRPRAPTSWSSTATPSGWPRRRAPVVLGDVTDDEVLARPGSWRQGASPRSTPTPTTSTSRCRPVRCVRTWSSSPGPATRRPSPSCCAPAPTESSTRSGSAASGWRRSRIQPHVAEFLDVVMHDEILDYRIEQVEIGADAAVRRTISDAELAERTGVVLLALRPKGASTFLANPGPASTLDKGSVAIVVGTASQLDQARRVAAG